jgi:hypothetical protein
MYIKWQCKTKNTHKKWGQKQDFFLLCTVDICLNWPLFYKTRMALVLYCIRECHFTLLFIARLTLEYLKCMIQYYRLVLKGAVNHEKTDHLGGWL